MRRIALLEAFLIEHNVVNTQAIMQYCREFAEECTNENAQQWFVTTLAKHLEKDEDINVPMTSANMPVQKPAWFTAAVQRGDDLRVFQAPRNLDDTFSHVVDFLNYLDKEDDRLLSDRTRVLAVTVPAMIQKSEEWVRADAKAAAKEDHSHNFRIIDRHGPYTWVEATNVHGLQRDGKILQNCIGTGTYDRCINADSPQRIYFLHDSRGEPHVAIRFNYQNNTIAEIKGKQNKPPMGRYITLTKDFLNKRKLTGGSNDIKNMGLIYDEATQLYGTKADLAKTVHTFPDGVYVVQLKNEGTVKSEYYGGRHHNTHVDGGMDYWFIAPNEGEIIQMNIGSKVRISSLMQSYGQPKLREYVQTFLNGMEVTPPPVQSSYGDGNKNGLDTLKLFYDWIARKYGWADEVSGEVMEAGGFKIYLRGISSGRNDFILHRDGEDLVSIQKEKEDTLGIPEYHGNGKLAASKDFKGVMEVMSALGMPPAFDPMNRKDTIERIGAPIYCLGGKYGLLEDVGEKVWESGEFALYKWDRKARKGATYASTNVGGTYYTMQMSGIPIFDLPMKKPAEITLCKGAPEGKLLTKVLTAALNGCRELAFAHDEGDYKFDEANVYYNPDTKKWGSRAKVGKLYHKFDDGFYIEQFMRGKVRVFTLYDPKGNALIGFDMSHYLKHHHVYTEGMPLVASRHIAWLLNDADFGSQDVVDAHTKHGMGNSSSAMLWQLGCFYDNRTETWKLIQDGKLIYAGTGYRVVKFRNRLFFIDDVKGILGYGKYDASGSHGHKGWRKYIADERTFPEQQIGDLYARISDFTRQSDEYAMTKASGGTYGYTELRDRGYFTDEDNEFKAIEEVHPTTVIMKFSRGLKWVRRVVEPIHKHRENHEKPSDKEYREGRSGEYIRKLHPERYSLEDKDGEILMRVSFDPDDGNFEDVVASVPEGEPDEYGHRRIHPDVKELRYLGEEQKKMLIALMEKTGKKFTPAQTREIGYYRLKNGKFKSFAGNAMLEGYLKGFIVFPDGHAFLWDQYGKEWDLGLVNPEPKYDSDRIRDKYITIKLDDEGLESVKYLNKAVKRKPQEYMPYIQKLMQIFALVAG